MDMDEAIRELQELANDAERGRRATEYLGKAQEWSLELTRLRREAVENMLRQDNSHADVAAAIGLSRGRIGQIAKTGPAPERAFLGDGKLTIVVGEKAEEGNSRPVIARETVSSYTRLMELAAAYQLESCYEAVPPPGVFDLNRDNLIVLSGPRLFPVVGQFLSGDPRLRFVESTDGVWSIRDLEANETYEATVRGTSDTPRDYGYLGRLPRPDGNGTFLCLGGLHATGTQGVVAYLEQNLPQLYSEVKNRRFSMVIECEYDPNTLEVTSTSQASPIYKRS